MTILNRFRSKQTLAAIAVFFSRLGGLAANVSPLGSFCFFGGSPILFATTVLAFDFLVGGLYKGFLWTYLGFAMYPIMGKLAQGKERRQMLLLPMASFLFFAISNLGVWWYWHPHTLQGLVTCYLLAVPFYARTLIGDLGFGYGFMAVRALLRKNSVIASPLAATAS